MTNPHGVFLGLSERYSDPAKARYAILPVPYEATVSYKPGTAGGPIAIIESSEQVELYDDELQAEFYQVGIATYPVVQPAPGPKDQIRRIMKAATPILEAGKFLLTLGGEHGITEPLVKAAAATCGDISVLQIDAHADLRNTYGGTEHSHATVMRRVLETTPRICQVGIRSYSKLEAEDCPDQIAKLITPSMIASDPNWIDTAVGMLGEKVYVTVDIDGFDPSIAPGTGTPEPGGLSWEQGIGLLRRVCSERQVVAADIVEVRPIPHNHVTEFLAAKLGYKIIVYTQI